MYYRVQQNGLRLKNTLRILFSAKSMVNQNRFSYVGWELKNISVIFSIYEWIMRFKNTVTNGKAFFKTLDEMLAAIDRINVKRIENGDEINNTTCLIIMILNCLLYSFRIFQELDELLTFEC